MVVAGLTAVVLSPEKILRKLTVQQLMPLAISPKILLPQVFQKKYLYSFRMPSELQNLLVSMLKPVVQHFPD